MIIFGIQENNQYVGFGTTVDITQEIDMYASTPIVVHNIGEADDETARNIVDYFTNLNGPLPHLDNTYYGLVDPSKYTLTVEGQAFWDANQ